MLRVLKVRVGAEGAGAGVLRVLVLNVLVLEVLVLNVRSLLADRSARTESFLGQIETRLEFAAIFRGSFAGMGSATARAWHVGLRI